MPTCERRGGWAYIVQRPRDATRYTTHAESTITITPICRRGSLFGTYRNPRNHAHATGFWHGASARVIDMLLLRDVSEPAKEQ